MAECACSDAQPRQDGFCAVEKNSEGHDICTITGMCVKMLSFSNEEFVDTACVMGEEDAGDAAPLHDVSLADSTGGSCAGDAFATSCRRSSKRSLPCPDDPQKSAKQAKAASAAASLRPSAPQTTSNMCSVNKKNRYRSWVYHRVMHRQLQPPARGGARCLGPLQKQAQLQNPTPPEPRAPPGAQPSTGSKRCDATRIGDLIQSFVEEVLCGPKWKVSMDTEEQKVHAKKRSLTLKAFKLLKGSQGSQGKICIPEAAALVASMMGNFRHSQVASTVVYAMIYAVPMLCAGSECWSQANASLCCTYAMCWL